jgi:zinc protease
MTVGSADESPDEAGAAHFLEHMLFKGTERRGVGEVAATIEGLGGDLNAYTTVDETCFHASLEASAWREALDVLVDMVRHSRLLPEEVERERTVILDEIAGYADDPEAVAGDQLMAMLYPEHPYGRPVLGTPDSVGSLSTDQLLGFWRRHYHPARGLLVVSGPVGADEVCAEVERLIAGWPAGAERAPASPAPMVARAARWLKRGTFDASSVHIGMPAVPHGHPDLPALEVLAAVLGQGASSVLPRRLELDEGVATRSWAQLSPLRLGGSLELGFQPNVVTEALPMALEALEEVARGGLDAEAVARARDGLLTDQLFSSETVEGRASDLVWALMQGDDPHLVERHQQAIAAVRPRQVQAVARRVLGGPRQLVALDPEATLADLDEAMRPRPRPAAPTMPSDGSPWVHTHDGVTLALLPDQGPLAAVRLLMHGGQLLDPPRAGGAARAWSEVVTRGAGSRPAQAFAERIDTLAAWLDGSSGRSSMGLSASCPADRLPGVLELVRDVLVDPHIDPVDVEHVVDDLRDDVDTRHDRPSQLANEALWGALYPNHPWQRPMTGSASSLDRIRPKLLSQLHRDAVHRDGLTIAITGGVDPGAARDWLHALVEALPEGRRPSAPAAPSAPRTPKPQRANGSQAAVVAGVRVGDVPPRRRLALAVASQLLDSQSGRLFLALREERGLAYSVWSHADIGPLGGMFQLGATCAPEQADQVAELLHAQFRQLALEGPRPDELHRTARMIVGLVAMRRQRVVGRASDLAWSTFTDRPFSFDELRQRLLSLGPGDVVEAMEELSDLRTAQALPR